jgi:putative phosphoesterase
MRLAVLSDVHGNLVALEAVLADIAAQGAPDLYWVLGDLALFGPWPGETVARLRALPQVAFLQGNTDRYLVSGRRPELPVRSAEEWARAPMMLAGRDAAFRWAVERLSYEDFLFLRDLPTRLEIDIAGYGRVVAFHATPADDETNWFPATPDEVIRPHVEALSARLMLYGHTHRPVDRALGPLRLVNDGSVGLPLDGEPRPSYVLLDFEQGQVVVTLRRVDYEREVVLAEMARVEHPLREWLIKLIREART